MHHSSTIVAQTLANISIRGACFGSLTTSNPSLSVIRDGRGIDNLVRSIDAKGEWRIRPC